MKIREHDWRGIPVLSLHGYLSGGDDCCALVDRVRDLAGEGQNEIVLDLSGTKFISSTGLGILVRARGEFLATGGMLRLCGLKNRNISVLIYTKTMLLFEVYDTERDALDAALEALQELTATELTADRD